MHFVLPFTQDDIVRADTVPITPVLVANATFEGVRAAFNYWVFQLRGVLQGLLNPTPRERAITSLLYRAIGYVASIRRLNHPMYVQSVASSARSLFEIGLDMALFHRDQTNNSVERVEAFTRVERYRVAMKLVDYYANRAVPADLSINEQRAIVADPVQLAAVEALIQQHWGRNRAGDLNWPKHWSVFPDARGRARAMGDVWEERYVRHYYMLSWHIHAGLTGVANLPREDFDIFASQAHNLATDVILDCYEVVGAELHLNAAIPQWADHLFFLQHAIGMALVDERLRALGEPVRFTYLEPHEHEIDR